MKLIVLLINLIFCFSVYAADDKDISFYVFDNFSKGLNSHASPYLIGNTSATNLQNVRFNKNYGAISNRPIMRSKNDFSDKTLELGSNPLKSIHRYYKSDGTQSTIVTGGTNVLASTSDTTSLIINTGMSDNARWQWLTYKDNAIGFSSDQPIKYDGKDDIVDNVDGNRTNYYLTAELGSCFAELNTGANLDASSWYQYKVVWYNSTTGIYYYSNAVSNAIKTGATVRDLYLTDIPLGPSGTTHRYIYRTEGKASAAALSAADYYMCYAIANNTATTQADSISDATLLTDRAPTWETVSGGAEDIEVTPPICKYQIIHDNRLFVAGDSDNPSYLYYSDEYNPDFFDPADVWYVREDDGDPITGFSELLGILNIYKTNSEQKLYTDTASESDWTLSNTFSKIGLSAPYSLATTPVGDIYLNRNGLYRFTGQSSQVISDSVTDIIQDINQVDLNEVVGYYFNNEYQLSYRSKETGSTINDRILIYDVVRDSYTLDTKNIDSFEAFDSGTDQGILYLGSSDTDAILWSNEDDIPILAKRFKSELDSGTFDDVYSFGTEDDSYLKLSWDCTLEGWLTELQLKDASITDIESIATYLPDATLERPDTSGTWTSSVYQINSNSLISLYWNEHLFSTGNVTWSIRTGATAAACAVAAWSGTYTDPTGSDISGETANDYIQLRASLSTTDIDISPEVYLKDGYIFKLTYTTSSSSTESNVLSLWESGWNDLGNPGYMKSLERMRVFYRGTTGTLIVNYKNDRNTIDNSFDIDLSVLPATDPNDEYEGSAENKIYSENLTYEGVKGTVFKFIFTYIGTDDFDIDRVEIAKTFEQSEDL